MRTLWLRVVTVVGFVAAWACLGPGCDQQASDADAPVAPDAPSAPDADLADALPIDAGPCDLACPKPAEGAVTVCGRLVDVETGQTLEAAGGGTGARCTDIPLGERSGPCSVRVQVYDLLGLAQNPTETPPLGADEAVVNDCGRFAVSNSPTPQLGLLGVLVDDAEGEADAWVATLSSSTWGWISGCSNQQHRIAVIPGTRVADFAAFAVSRSLDEAWTASAGSPFEAATFSEQGAVLFFYRSGGVPVPGVRISRDPSGPREEDDYYFSDPDSATATTVVASPPGCVPGPDCQPASGVNGAALLVNSGLVDHSGEGGLPEQCSWPDGLASSIPGMLWASTADAIRVDDQAQLCP